MMMQQHQQHHHYMAMQHPPVQPHPHPQQPPPPNQVICYGVPGQASPTPAAQAPPHQLVPYGAPAPAAAVKEESRDSQLVKYEDGRRGASRRDQQQGKGGRRSRRRHSRSRGRKKSGDRRDKKDKRAKAEGSDDEEDCDSRETKLKRERKRLERLDAERRAKEEEIHLRELELRRKHEENINRQEEESRQARARARILQEQALEHNRKIRLLQNEERQREANVAKRKQEEELRIRDEKKVVKAKEKGALVILRLLVKLMNAPPEHVERLEVELEEAMANTQGYSAPWAKPSPTLQEINRVLFFSKKHFNEVRDRRQKVEATEQATRAILQELRELAVAVEKDLEEVETCWKEYQPSDDQQQQQDPQTAKSSPKELGSLLRAVGNVEEAAARSLEAGSKFAKLLSAEALVTVKEPPSLRDEAQSSLEQLRPRMQQATAQMSEVVKKAVSAKASVCNSFITEKKARKEEAQKGAYDKDGDGYFNETEVMTFAEEVYDYKLSQSQLDRIMHQLAAPESPGVRVENLVALRTAIGIAREEARAVERKAAREEQDRVRRETEEMKKAMVQEKLQQLQGPVKDIQAVSAVLMQAVAEVEGLAHKMTTYGASMLAQELSASSESICSKVESAMISSRRVRDRSDDLLMQAQSLTEVEEVLRPQIESCIATAEDAEQRLLVVEGVGKSSKAIAIRKAFAEKEAMRMEVASKLRICYEAQDGNPEDLFDFLSTEDEMDLVDVMDYLAKAKCSIDTSKLEAVFGVTAKIEESKAEVATKEEDELEKVAAQGASVQEITSATSAAAKDEVEAGDSSKPQVKEEEAQDKEGQAKDGLDKEKQEPEKQGQEQEQEHRTGQEEAQDGQKDAAASSASSTAAAAATSAKIAAVKKEEPDAVAAKAAEKGDGGGIEEKDDKAAKPPRTKGELISRQDFGRVLRLFYRVTKEVTLSDNRLLAESRQLRRLAVGEVMDVLRGPMLDPSSGVYRVYGQALKDGILGYASISGKKAGSSFLIPMQNSFRVLKPVSLHKELKDTGDANVIRELVEGEVLEVVDWSRNAPSATSLSRVQARLQEDPDVAGWATIADASGTMFLEAA